MLGLVNMSTSSTHGPRRRSPEPEERQIDAERSRAALLDAALEEFSTKGFAGARIRDIAARAGVSKDLIAYHFGSKEGIYLAVQHTWLERENSFADPHSPLAELVTRHMHDALDDPRRLRLLIWRGLSTADQSPPDATANVEDLSSTRSRQADGELPDDIEPATLRLALLAIVTAPVVFPDMTRKLFGTAPTDPDFTDRYARGIRSLLAHLESHHGASAGPE